MLASLYCFRCLESRVMHRRIYIVPCIKPTSSATWENRFTGVIRSVMPPWKKVLGTIGPKSEELARRYTEFILCPSLNSCRHETDLSWRKKVSDLLRKFSFFIDIGMSLPRSQNSATAPHTPLCCGTNTLETGNKCSTATEVTIETKILVETPTRKRPFLRPRCDDNIKMNL
jgi:hypothetical protein